MSDDQRIPLIVDPERTVYASATCIYVRAKLQGKWGSYDIAQLDRESLLVWMRGCGDSAMAERVVLMMLDHDT
jgi:hypothetical protein